jgi:hypothetical protein
VNVFTSWTDRIMNEFPPPQGPPFTPPSVSTDHPVAPPPPKRWQRVAVGVTIAAVAAIGIGAAIASRSEPGDRESTASETPPPASNEPTEPGDASASEGEGAVMPDVVCMNLQDAQDTIQTTGVFFSRSRDATGEGRHQIIDSNWQVVAQTPAPGTPIGEFEAVLDVVKFGEPSPC